MRILEVIPSFEPLGGAENFVFNLSLALSNAGAEVFVISLYDIENSFIAENLKKNGINIIYLSKRKGLDLKSARLFAQKINSLKPDVVHLHLNSYLIGLPSMLARKSKFVYTFHTLISHDTHGHKNNPSNLLIKFLIKKRYMFPVTISDSIDDSFKSFFGDYKREIIYNGINTSTFSYNNNRIIEYTFISVGSFNDIKNNLFMIKCVERLIVEGYNINYIVLGNGKNFEPCKSYCEQNGLNKRINLLGSVNNVEDYLSKAGCLLLASHWEGNPLVINEAIASGVWVVANSVGGVKDLIDDTNGYLVIPENESDFIDKMKAFITNERKIVDTIIPNNIERNRNRVDMFNTCSKYLCLMEKMVERGTK